MEGQQAFLSRDFWLNICKAKIVLSSRRILKAFTSGRSRITSSSWHSQGTNTWPISSELTEKRNQLRGMLLAFNELEKNI